MDSIGQASWRQWTNKTTSPGGGKKAYRKQWNPVDARWDHVQNQSSDRKRRRRMEANFVQNYRQASISWLTGFQDQFEIKWSNKSWRNAGLGCESCKSDCKKQRQRSDKRAFLKCTGRQAADTIEVGGKMVVLRAQAEKEKDVDQQQEGFFAGLKKEEAARAVLKETEPTQSMKDFTGYWESQACRRNEGNKTKTWGCSKRNLWKKKHGSRITNSSRSDASNQICGRRQYDHGQAAPGRNDEQAKRDDWTDEGMVCANSARVSAAVGSGKRWKIKKNNRFSDPLTRGAIRKNPSQYRAAGRRVWKSATLPSSAMTSLQGLEWEQLAITSVSTAGRSSTRSRRRSCFTDLIGTTSHKLKNETTWGCLREWEKQSRTNRYTIELAANQRWSMKQERRAQKLRPSLLFLNTLKCGFVSVPEIQEQRLEHKEDWGTRSWGEIPTNKEKELFRGRKKKHVQNSFREEAGRKETKAEKGNMNELTLISANVTSWKKKFNEIARLNPDTMALQETKVTKAAKPAANRAAGSEKLSVIWGKPCDLLKKKREGQFIAETRWMGRQGGVAVLAKNELGILAGGMEGKTLCELYESARYVRAAIPVRHGNRKLFIHVASLYNENTRSQRSYQENEERKSTRESIHRRSSTWGSSLLPVRRHQHDRGPCPSMKRWWQGTWVDVGTRYTTEDEAEPTYAGFKNWDKRSRGRKVTIPDRILANKLAMGIFKSFRIVRRKHFARSSSSETDFEHSAAQAKNHSGEGPEAIYNCREKAVELANEKREEIEQAPRDGHDDQAWSLVSTVAESYLEWRCSSSKGDTRKGGKGRCGEPKTKECFLAASIGERSCDSPATKLTRKLQKSRRQAVEIQTKLNSRKAEEIDTRMQIVQLWNKNQEDHREQQCAVSTIVQVYVSMFGGGEKIVANQSWPPQTQDCHCSTKVCHKLWGEELKANKHNCQEKEKERDPSHAAVMAVVPVEETDEARWAKMPPRMRTRDQKRVLHNRTAVERGLHLFPPFKSMNEWTVKCLRCERDIDLWTWSGQKKIFNLTARLELKCGGDEFQGEEHSAVRRNGAVNPAIRQLQNQNNKKRRSKQKQLVNAAKEAHFLLVQPDQCWRGSVQTTTMLAVQRTTKYDDLANPAACWVSADKNKKSTPSPSTRRNPTSGGRSERNCAWRSVQRYDLRSTTVARFSGLHHRSPDRVVHREAFVGELSKVCSQVVLKCLYLTRIGRPDILWSVNKLACAITKWTRTCDKRLARLISYIHHTCGFKQYIMWEIQHNHAD